MPSSPLPLRWWRYSSLLYSWTVRQDDSIFDGVGDVKAPFLISTLSLWAVRLVPTWLCVTRFGLGLEVVWICMVGDNVLRCLLLLGCFFGRNWKAYLEKKLVRPGDRDGQRS